MALAMDSVTSKTWPQLRSLYFVLAAAVFIAAAAVEGLVHRPWLGPDQKFGFWCGSIWSSECSQRLADPYSFSHIVHGIVFYGLLWLCFRKASIAARFLTSVVIECAWEVGENLPFIIERFRAANATLGYNGDSIMNSLSDVVMMAFGFWIAWKFTPWKSLVAALVMEIGCALWVRDNMTLQLAMLLHPIKAVQNWQNDAAPASIKAKM